MSLLGIGLTGGECVSAFRSIYFLSLYYVGGVSEPRPIAHCNVVGSFECCNDSEVRRPLNIFSIL